MPDMVSTPGTNGQSASFLTVVIDVNPYTWASSVEDIAATLVPSLLVFINAHLALAPSNGVAIYTCTIAGTARLLFSTASHSQASQRAKAPQDTESLRSENASTYQHFAILAKAVRKGVQEVVAQLQDTLNDDATVDEADSETAIVKALGMALSHLNRAHADRSQSSIAGSSDPLPPSKSTPLNTGSSSHTTSGDDARILVVSSTSSASNQYVGLMNCIFAAQKRRIPIDVLKIAGEDTVFLQQAASLTKGLYLRAGELKQGRLLQTLLTTFLPPPSWRTRLLNLPTLDEVDFRASCFCHGAIVDVGYVCGVCLSIFCHPPPRCLICNSAFPRKTLKKFRDDLTAPRAPVEDGEAEPTNGDV